MPPTRAANPASRVRQSRRSTPKDFRTIAVIGQDVRDAMEEYCYQASCTQALAMENLLVLGLMAVGFSMGDAEELCLPLVRRQLSPPKKSGKKAA